MLDQSGAPRVLRIPAAITKNCTGRTLGLEGEVRAIIERRLNALRFDTPLIFHRVCKGNPGQPITDFWDVWRNPFGPRGRPRSAPTSEDTHPAPAKGNTPDPTKAGS